ncbi:MAG: DUF5718 family protein [Succinivibrionaceae bacterium]
MKVEELKDVIGLGVAGNFAGHLEQAGEAKDFLKVKVNDIKAPKALFPFYLPNPEGRIKESFLRVFPLSSEELIAPKDEGDNLQIEPEIGLLCDIVYDGLKVIKLVPKFFGAYNDCSIRRQGAKKISEKKNWGCSTKGYSQNLIAIDEFSEKGIISKYKIACFLKRNGELYTYGVDSYARDYSYMYQNLLDWMIDKMNNQQDEGPAEPISEYLELCNKPQRALFSIGATRYTEFGQTHYLEKNDDSYVIVYPESYSFSEIEQMVKNDVFDDLNISVLHQKVK